MNITAQAQDVTLLSPVAVTPFETLREASHIHVCKIWNPEETSLHTHQQAWHIQMVRDFPLSLSVISHLNRTATSLEVRIQGPGNLGYLKYINKQVP